MEKGLRILNTLSKLIDLNNFYVIEIWGKELKLQGYYKPELIVELKKLKFFLLEIDEKGFINLKRNYISVVLTK